MTTTEEVRVAVMTMEAAARVAATTRVALERAAALAEARRRWIW